MVVACFGDLGLDVIVRLEQPLARGADTRSRVSLHPGGQAANVAAWVAVLGGRARLIAKRGSDDAGRVVDARLAAFGVEVVGPLGTGRGGVIVSLVGADGERSMCSDRGVAVDFHPDELDPGWLSGCDHLHVSSYALAREPVRAAATRAIAIARRNGARVSIDLSSWSVIRDVGPSAFRAAVAMLDPDVVFANEEEDEIVGGPISGPAWILKRGPSGCSFDGDERAPAPTDRVVDTTGAGDALAAGWIVGGPDLALQAAARCVGHTGAMPPTADA